MGVAISRMAGYSVSVVVSSGEGGLRMEPSCEHCGASRVREVPYSERGQPLLPNELDELAWTDYLCDCGVVRLRIGKRPE